VNNYPTDKVPYCQNK